MVYVPLKAHTLLYMIEHCLQACKESSISGRYLPPQVVENWLQNLPSETTVIELGRSVQDHPIFAIEIGSGPTNILGWSQMHGNESTTTKAVIDLLNLLIRKPVATQQVDEILSKYRLHFILQLNPDGAAAYTRANAQGIDLNRDAQDRSQPESRILADYYQQLSPDLCLNLHDQRSIYGFTNGKPAGMAFLAPAADQDLGLTNARREAIKHIDRILAGLSPVLPGMIGRYDDSFNPNCVGDRFQMLGTPTILFEAGHVKDDYPREHAREWVLRALLLLLGFPASKSIEVSYHLLPENQKNFYDMVFRNGRFGTAKGVQDLAIQYEEVLQDSSVIFTPVVAKIAPDLKAFGHKEVDMMGAEILINSCENVFENENLLTITEKNPPYHEFFANM